MPNILITYGTRPLAQRLQKLLHQQQITFATCEEVPSIFANRYHNIPHAANPVFAHEVLKSCLDLNTDYVLPLHPAEITVLKDTQVLFDEYGIQILVPESEHETESVQNPPSDYPLELFCQGKSLLSCTETSGEETGLYALIDEKWMPVTL